MRLKLDENLPTELTEAVLAAGHDAHTVHEEHLNGRADDDVWQAAQAENRTVVTLDNDFGRRAVQSLEHAGVLILRPLQLSRSTITHLALRALEELRSIDWRGRLVIAEGERLRIRPPLRLV
jgi:predicted nuclease of predicted toxin-antitoxin system